MEVATQRTMMMKATKRTTVTAATETRSKILKKGSNQPKENNDGDDELVTWMPKLKFDWEWPKAKRNRFNSNKSQYSSILKGI